MRTLELLAGLFTLVAANAHAVDPVYMCAYQNGDRSEILRVIVKPTEIQWVHNDSVYYQAGIIHDYNGRVIAAADSSIAMFQADLFMLDEGDPGRAMFAWTRSSPSAKPDIKHGDCEKVG